MPKFDHAVFPSVLRYLILAAQNKRVVPYNELEAVFGFSHNMAGYYAGMVGEFCLAQEWPLLNSLVVNTTYCVPSSGFDSFQERSAVDSWGECLAACWKHFHVSSSRQKQVQNFTGLTALARDWAQEQM